MYHGQKYFINVSLLPWKKQHTVFEDHLLELWMPANETLVNLTKPWNECLCLTEPQVRLASVAWLSSVNILCFILIGAIFVWPWKMVSVSVCYLFYKPMDERSKHGLFVFPPKETLIWRKHCSIGQLCYSMMSKQSISWFLESSWTWSFFHPSIRLTDQKPHVFVSIR